MKQWGKSTKKRAALRGPYNGAKEVSVEVAPKEMLLYDVFAPNVNYYLF